MRRKAWAIVAAVLIALAVFGASKFGSYVDELSEEANGRRVGFAGCMGQEKK
jgi:hypothetical protein